MWNVVYNNRFNLGKVLDSFLLRMSTKFLNGVSKDSLDAPRSTTDLTKSTFKVNFQKTLYYKHIYNTYNLMFRLFHHDYYSIAHLFHYFSIAHILFVTVIKYA